MLNADEARALLDAIDVTTLTGLRDRALIGVMVFTFARVNAVIAMKVKDYFFQGRRGWVRLHEKGGKEHEVPCHHTLERYLDEYIASAGIGARQWIQPPGGPKTDPTNLPAHEKIVADYVEKTRWRPRRWRRVAELRIALRLQRETADRPHRDRKAWSLHPAAYK